MGGTASAAQSELEKKRKEAERTLNNVNRELSNAGNAVNSVVAANQDTIMDVYTGGLSFLYREGVEKPATAARKKMAAEKEASDQAIAVAKEEDVKKEMLTERDKKRSAQRIKKGSRSRSTVMTGSSETVLGSSTGKTILGV